MPITHVRGNPVRTSPGRRSLRGAAAADAGAPAATNALSQRQLVEWSLLVRPNATRGDVRGS